MTYSTQTLSLLGYLLVFLMILIATTAFMRHKAISYETFYLFHSLIIVLYILSIVHTFDNVSNIAQGCQMIIFENNVTHDFCSSYVTYHSNHLNL